MAAEKFSLRKLQIRKINWGMRATLVEKRTIDSKLQIIIKGSAFFFKAGRSHLVSNHLKVCKIETEK